MTTVELTFGQWLKQRRRALDLTQDELARRVGCSTMMIYKIEAGERRPSRQIAELLADRLELSSEERPAFVRYARAQAPASDTPTLLVLTPTAARRQASSLPTPSSPFVGREGELRDLLRLLADPSCRMLTLTGPGGIGKTRLAIELAARHTTSLADGICFVALASLSRADQIAHAIATALGEPLGGDVTLARLLEILREKELLLVLDNLEQIADAAAVLAELLQAAPQLRLLVTSRERLGLSYEWVFEVWGLPTAAAEHGSEQSDALALFMQSARRADACFGLRPHDLAHINRICSLVDGVPLGIELAAAWVRTLSVEEIANEIARNIDFLAASSRDLPDRHRSLRAIFDHSWNLLSDEQRHTLRRLAVFHGGFTREAAVALVGDKGNLLATLGVLVDKSLLRRRESGRYDLHELVRQYTGEQLARDPDALHDAGARHADYYAQLLRQREQALKGAAQQAAVAELEAEIDNLRQAWSFVIEQRCAVAIRTMTRSLGWFYELRCMLNEGAAAFERAASALEGSAAADDADTIVARGQALTYQGWFRFRLGQTGQALAQLRQAVEQLRPAGDIVALTDALLFLGTITQILGDYASGHDLLVEGLAYSLESGNRWATAFCLSQLGLIAHSQGDQEQARELLGQSLELSQAISDPRGTAFSLGMLGAVSLARGRHREAQRLLRESLTLSSTLGNAWGVGSAFNHLGQIAYDLGEYSEARYLFRESLAMFRQIGERWSTARMLNNLGLTYQALGDEREARRAFIQALRQADEAHALPIALDSLAGLAALMARRSECAAAAELAVQVIRHPASGHAARARATGVAGHCSPSYSAPARPLAEVIEELLES